MATTTTGVPDQNLDLLVEQLRQGKAMFSTNMGKYPIRRAQPLSTPVILRSDCDADLAAMIAELRIKFPLECKKITLPVNNIYEYFDHYDVNIQGSAFIFQLLALIAQENKVNTRTAQQFATKWMEDHTEGFPDINLDDEGLLSIEDKERYSSCFLEDVLEFLKGFQTRSVVSSERTIDRGRLAEVSTRHESTSSIRQDSLASSSFESNPSNDRRAASASRERPTFLTPPMAVGALLMTDRAYTKRRNSARFVSAELGSSIPPVLYHSDTDAESGVGSRHRLPLPSEPQLQNLHMHHSARSLSENMAGVTEMGQTLSNRSKHAPGALEPFPAYFQVHNLGGMNAGSSRTLNRNSRGQPFGQQGTSRQAQYGNVQPGWSYIAASHHASSPAFRMFSNSNAGSRGNHRRNFSASQVAHSVYSSDPTFPVSSNASSVRLSPVLGGQALPHIPIAVPQTTPGLPADVQSYTYHGYIENMTPSSMQALRKSPPSQLLIPRVRNNNQSQASQPTQNVPTQNVATQLSRQPPANRYDHQSSHGELQGRGQNQAASRNNPRKSISDDARITPPGDINSQRSSISEHHTSRRGSSGELFNSIRDHNDAQQQHRRTSGARSGSRHSSFSQSQQPYRDQYKRSVQGTYGGYSPMGYFSAGRGSGDQSHLIHQTIEEHRSDGDRNSIADHNYIARSDNDMGDAARSRPTMTMASSTSDNQEQGIIPIEQVRQMEIDSDHDRSYHLSTMQLHDTLHPRNNTSDNQPLPSTLTTSTSQGVQGRYSRYYRSERAYDPIKLYIVAPTESADEIHEVFRPYGNIVELIGPFTRYGVKTYPDGGPPSFYFLSYSQPAEANTAVERLDRTALPSGLGQLKVSFAFKKSPDVRGVHEMTSPAEPSMRSAYPRDTHPLRTSNSQTLPRAQLRAEDSLPANQDFLYQRSVSHPVQGDAANTISTQNIKKSSNKSNPSTPKKKKNSKKSKNPTPIRREAVSSVDAEPRVTASVSQIPYTPESRAKGKEVREGTAETQERATRSDQNVPSAQTAAQTSSKNCEKPEGDKAETTPEILPAAVEDTSSSVSHEQNLTQQNDSRVNREELNILDGSPSRKPRNHSLSRKLNQPPSQPSPTEPSGRNFSGNPAVPGLSEDQWPALQRPSATPSPKEGQHESSIATRRLHYRAISSKTSSGASTKAFSKTAKTKEVNDPGEGPSNAAPAVTTPIVTRPESLDRSGHLNENLDTTSLNHNLGDVDVHNVNLPRDIRIRVPTTPSSIEASRETSSAGGYNTTDLPSYSQTECSNSWAEDSELTDISPPIISSYRENTTTKPALDIVKNTSETPYISSMSEVYETKDDSCLDQVPKHGYLALSSDVGIESTPVPCFDGNTHENAATLIPTADVQSPPLSESYDGIHEKTEIIAGITTSMASFVENRDTNIKLSWRAKGKQRVLTIDVPPRSLPSTSINSAQPPPSKSPKNSKSKQDLVVCEPPGSSSIPEHSPAISTHMKKKTKKITPPRKTSRNNGLTKKDTKSGQSLTISTELVPRDGISKDAASSGPTLEQDKSADVHDSTIANSELARAPQSTMVDLTIDQDKTLLDETQKDEASALDPAQSDGQASLARTYPAPDPSNAVYVSELQGPYIAKRKSLGSAQSSSDSQLVQVRNYPPPDPSSAVYVTGRVPTRTIVMDNSNQVKNEEVAASPPSSPDMPSKKDRTKAKKNKKRKSKNVAEFQDASESHLIMPFPEPKLQSAAFPTLPLNEPSPTDPLSQGSSELEVEMSDPFGVFDPVLNVEQTGHRERRSTEIWTTAVNEKRSDTTAMMILKNKAMSPDREIFDNGAQDFQKRKASFSSELFRYIDNIDANRLGLTLDTTSRDLDSSSIEFAKQDMTDTRVSTRSSINGNGSVPELTRGSSIVSSSSNLIFLDVPGDSPNPLSAILAPVNLTHEPNFDSSKLETSNLKARPPQHHPEFDDDIFDRPAGGIESPPKSPLTAEFGSGSISAVFKPDVEHEEVGSEATTPILSSAKPLCPLNLLDAPSTILEGPLKKMKLSEKMGSTDAASGFEKKSSNTAEAPGSYSEELQCNDTASEVPSLFIAEPEADPQLSDDLKFVVADPPSRGVKTPNKMETSEEVQPERKVLPSLIVDDKNVVSDTKNLVFSEANIESQRPEESKSMGKIITDEKNTSLEKVGALEFVELGYSMEPSREVDLEGEAMSSITEPSNKVADGNDTFSTKSGSLSGPSNVVGRPGIFADTEGLPSPEQGAPAKIAEDVEPFSAISEASTVTAAFPSLPSSSFSSTANSSPPKLSEANIAAHTIATDSDEAREQRRSRNESVSEWSTTSSFRRKTYSEAANVASPTGRSRGQSMMSPADSEAEVDVKRAVKPRRGEANLWSLPPKEQRWTSAEE